MVDDAPPLRLRQEGQDGFAQGRALDVPFDLRQLIGQRVRGHPLIDFQEDIAVQDPGVDRHLVLGKGVIDEGLDDAQEVEAFDHVQAQGIGLRPQGQQFRPRILAQIFQLDQGVDEAKGRAGIRLDGRGDRLEVQAPLLRREQSQDSQSLFEKFRVITIGRFFHFQYVPSLVQA